MPFGGNTTPRKFGRGGETRKPWLCGCGITQSKFVLFCKRCERGQVNKELKV